MEYTKNNCIITREQRFSKIQNFSLLSDVFLSVALNDVPACQHVLRILTGKKDLFLKEVHTQYTISKISAHSSRLDVFAESKEGTLYNLEIQRKDAIDHEHRTRFYSALIDGESLEKGTSYEYLPDVHIFYISETDLQKAGKTIYPVEQILGGTNIPYEDGRHITYVNTAVDDGTEIAKLMRYFKTADPYDMSQGDLSKRVHFLKCEEGGFDLMCNVTDQFIQLGREAGLKEGHETGLKIGLESGLLKGKKETAINLAAMGMTLDLIAKAVGETCPVVKQWLESTC